jgi:hypothetical protein
MSKKNKTFSRNEPTATSVSVAPAGTPTEVSAPEVPSPTDTAETVTPEESSVAEQPVGVTQSQEIVSAIKQEQPRGGASFFIPAQKQSGFGAK